MPAEHAFLLSGAAEVLPCDVSQVLALGLPALIAVPWVRRRSHFVWTAAAEPAHAEYAVADMTGANRLLISAAWPLVALIGWRC